MICCVIPAYKARNTVCDVVYSLFPYVDTVVVVDDACPQTSGRIVKEQFANDRRVVVLERDKNGGVGAAVKTGLAYCLAAGARYVVKVDADGQMDPAYIPQLIDVLQSDESIGFVKGNRFVNASVLASMPKARLLGNAMLSIFVKFASGYWNLLDPTNGFVAFSGDTLRQLDLDALADSYFFEISVLGQLGIKQLTIAEVEMPTIYGAEQSSLSIRRVLLEFPPKLLAIFVKRVALQYFLFDINLGSLYLFFGSLITMLGVSMAIWEWFASLLTHHVRTAGTVMLAVLPLLIGFQLLSNALLYDVQFAPKTVRELKTRPKDWNMVKVRLRE